MSRPTFPNESSEYRTARNELLDAEAVLRERLEDVAALRRRFHLRLLSSANNTYHSDYFAEDEQGNQWPMANVFVKRGKAIHHFWGSELLFRKYGQGDMRHIDLLWPLWNVLDLSPEGRGATWYPALSYVD